MNSLKLMSKIPTVSSLGDELKGVDSKKKNEGGDVAEKKTEESAEIEINDVDSENESEQEGNYGKTGEVEEGDEYDHPTEEAIIWCEEHFPTDRSCAKYFPFARDRSHEDIMAMHQVREWVVKLREIKYRNHSDEGDFFVTFNVGWDFKVTRKLHLPRATGEARRGEDDTASKKTKPRWEWIKKGDKGEAYVTHVESNVKKGKLAEFGGSETFTWHGSYFDLMMKKLHVEVWSWNLFKANEFLGVAEMPLNELANGEMTLGGSEWEIKAERKKRKGRKEQIVLGALEFQCIFQERLKHVIKLQNWGISFSPWNIIDPPEEGDEVAVDVYAKFLLYHRSIVGSIPISSVRTRKVRLRIKGRGDDDVQKRENERFQIDFGSAGKLSFIGTRYELEDKTLEVKLFIKGSLRSHQVGRASIPLKGVVHDGYLSSKVTWKRSDSSCLCLSASESQLRNVGTVSGSFDVECEEVITWPWAAIEGVGTALNVIFYPAKPILHAFQKNQQAIMWREFAQTGELQPPELRDYSPYNYSYLAVKIISAKNLIGADANGLSDPYVTLTWAGQRVKTKIVKETLNPIFDETIYFHIRSYDPSEIKTEELVTVPYVRIGIWDWDEAGSSDFLGTAKLYLHWITGCSDDEHFPVVRPERMNIRKRKSNIIKKYYNNVIQTRVFRGDIRLDGLAAGIDSSIKVQAWFRSPDGDLTEPDPNARARNGTDLMLLPNLEKQRKKMMMACICYHSEATEMVNGVAQRLLCPPCKNGSDICETFSKFYETLNNTKVGKALEQSFGGIPVEGTASFVQRVEAAAQMQGIHELRSIKERVKEMEIDFSSINFCVLNQYNERHFLPTYLHPITPPKSMIDPDEEAYMLIRSSQKPNSCYRAAAFVKSMVFEEFEDRDQVTEGAVAIHKNTWLSPDFFLNMKKGDIKAHVLLLANIFLGLRTDAYVCLGYAYSREEDSSVKNKNKKASKVDTGNLDDEFDTDDKVPYIWLMTRESNSDCCLSSDNEKNGVKLDDMYGGAVKFWDVTLGSYYPPLPNRWKGQKDKELLEQARRGQKKAKNKAKKKSRGTRKKNREGKHSSSVARTDHVKEREPTEEDFIDTANVLDENDLIDSEEIFRLGATIGDGFPTYEGGNLRKTSFKNLRDAERAERSMKKQGSKNVFETDSFDDEGENTGDEKRKEEITEYRKRLDWVVRHVKHLKRLKKRQINIPFCEIVAVFNHNNLWVNIHESTDPRKICYDIESGKEFGWLPVVPGYTKGTTTHIQSHYPVRSLGPSLSTEVVSKLQNTVYQEIVSGLENYRNSLDIPTRIADEQSNIPALISQLLSAKYDYDLVDKSKANGWVPGNRQWRQGTAGSEKYLFYLKKLKRLHGTCLTGYRYRLTFVKVNSSDPKEIRKAMLQKQREETGNTNTQAFVPVSDISYNGRETFAVGVKVIPLMGSICTVLVGLMCIFPKSTEEHHQVSDRASTVVSGLVDS